MVEFVHLYQLSAFVASFTGQYHHQYLVGHRMRKIFLALPLFLISLTTTQAQTEPIYSICQNTTTFRSNSNFENNLKSLLYSFQSDETPSNGFYNRSVGHDPDVVWGFYLCRGDVSNDVCQQCVNAAARKVFDYCPDGKVALVWYDYCFLRYSNSSWTVSYSSFDTSTTVYAWNPNNITGNQSSFNELVANTMKETAEEALLSSKKFAMKEVISNSFPTMYTLAQCTPDISTSECQLCLQSIISLLPDCCQNKQGGRIFTPSCNFRYDISSIAVTPQLPPSEPLLPPPPPLPTGMKRSDSRKMKIIVSISSIIGLVLLLLLGCYIYTLRRRKNLKKAGVSETSQELHLLDLGRSRNRNRNPRASIEEENPIESQDFPFIPLNVVHKATQHFSDENKLGEGGFGPVYKGALEDGKEIAVKRLSRNSGQGMTELMNEITLIARLQHRNLVRLVGCCLEKNEKLLIYEYMPNKSLDLFLFDPNLAVQLDWQRRLSIINGIARGLMYLHEDSRLKIIHRDLKVSNVLLDDDMHPKISDFGMARIFGGNQNQANTNRVVGTYGYMAPEYAMEGVFSEKSDVFSFGVMVLEIISGKKNSGFHLSKQGESLLTHAWKLWSKGEGLELIEPLLTKSRVIAEVLKCIHIGMLCVQEDPADRPFMSHVVVMLASDTITLPRPTEPAFSVGRVVPISSESSSDKICSVNEVTLSGVEPR